jgi:small GTP-binding protein
MRTATASSTGKSLRSEKIVLIGAASSGKTSLVNRLVNDRFQQTTEATIGASFVSKVLSVNNIDIKLDLWDTGGTEKYRSLAPMYYRDARAAVIVFDVTNKQSFTEAAEWLSEFRERGQPGALVVAAANKIDLEDKRAVTKDEADEFWQVNQVEFTQETSALSGVGVKDLFVHLAEHLLALPSPGGFEIEISVQTPPAKDPCPC